MGPSPALPWKWPLALALHYPGSGRFLLRDPCCQAKTQLSLGTEGRMKGRTCFPSRNGVADGAGSWSSAPCSLRSRSNLRAPGPCVLTTAVLAAHCAHSPPRGAQLCSPQGLKPGHGVGGMRPEWTSPHVGLPLAGRTLPQNIPLARCSCGQRSLPS